MGLNPYGWLYKKTIGLTECEMDSLNYFFIDGSSLIADIGRFWKKHEKFNGKKVHLSQFAHRINHHSFRHLSEGGFKRVVFYFVNGDKRIDKYFIMPDLNMPGTAEDVQLKYCGKKIKGSKYAYKWLDKHEAPDSVREIVNKSEKAVDTQICCDALSLSCHRHLDRLYLYANDYDYQPLCEALKSNGSNISLIGILPNVNKDLRVYCDTFDIVPELNDLFIDPAKPVNPTTAQV